MIWKSVATSFLPPALPVKFFRFFFVFFCFLLYFRSFLLIFVPFGESTEKFLIGEHALSVVSVVVVLLLFLLDAALG